MLYKTTLAGLACAIGLSTGAFGQHLEQWAPHASLGGAIGGYGILGSTSHDNAPLWALYLDRYAHVTGNYSKAIVKFDRVMKPDGRLIFIEHGSAPDLQVQNWQNRLTPVWKELAGGCHLNRHVRTMLGR